MASAEGVHDGVTIEVVTTQAQLEECYAVRFEVFVEEQKVPADEELDDLDVFRPDARHLIGLARRDPGDLEADDADHRAALEAGVGVSGQGLPLDLHRGIEPMTRREGR